MTNLRPGLLGYSSLTDARHTHCNFRFPFVLSPTTSGWRDLIFCLWKDPTEQTHVNYFFFIVETKRHQQRSSFFQLLSSLFAILRALCSDQSRHSDKSQEFLSFQKKKKGRKKCFSFLYPFVSVSHYSFRFWFWFLLLFCSLLFSAPVRSSPILLFFFFCFWQSGLTCGAFFFSSTLLTFFPGFASS